MGKIKLKKHSSDGQLLKYSASMREREDVKALTDKIIIENGGEEILLAEDLFLGNRTNL